MRVLIVDSGFQYSTLPIGESYYRAFLDAGYEVMEYDTRAAFNESKDLVKVKGWHHLTEYISSPILNWIIQENIDILIAIHGYHLNVSIVDSARRLGCRTGLIMTDEPQQMDISRTWSQYYDYVFVNDRNVLKFHRNSYYLPVAVDETIFKKQEVEDKYKSDILVGGSLYKERFEFLEDPDLIECFEKYDTKFVGARRGNFKQNRINKFFQHNAENSKISYEEMAKYTAGAKVCIDIPRNEFRDGIFGDVNTKRIKASCLSPRIFEAATAGCLVLTTGYRNDIFDLFPEDIFPIYSDQSHLVELIERYLNEKKEREKLVNKQRNHILGNHTYRKRAEEICKVMELKPTKKIEKSHPINRFTIRNWENEWRNNVKNLEKYYIPENSLEKLKDKFNGECLIVSNGPSLELYPPYRNKPGIECRFFMNDAIRHGYYNDKNFGVVIHPASDVYERCIQKETPCFPLICSTVVNYKVVEHWIDKQEVYFFHTGVTEFDSIKTEIQEKYNFPILSAGLSVGYSVITIAIYMGFKTISFFGLDFCYRDMKRYAYEDCKYKDFSKINFKLAEASNGDPVLTDDTLLKSRDTIIELIGRNPKIKFNVYGRGLLYSQKLENLIAHG